MATAGATRLVIKYEKKVLMSVESRETKTPPAGQISVQFFGTMDLTTLHLIVLLLV